MKEDGFEQLKVFEMAYGLAMKIFELSKGFPTEEKYALTDQIRRSSRSVCANLAEAYRKRLYPKHYMSKMSDADGECSETLVWLRFACDCKYVEADPYELLRNDCQEVGKMLGYMMAHPVDFGVKVD